MYFISTWTKAFPGPWPRVQLHNFCLCDCPRQDELLTKLEENHLHVLLASFPPLAPPPPPLFSLSHSCCLGDASYTDPTFSLVPGISISVLTYEQNIFAYFCQDLQLLNIYWLPAFWGRFTDTKPNATGIRFQRVWRLRKEKDAYSCSFVRNLSPGTILLTKVITSWKQCHERRAETSSDRRHIWRKSSVYLNQIHWRTCVIPKFQIRESACHYSKWNE